MQAESGAATRLIQTSRWLEAVKIPIRFKLANSLFRNNRLYGCDLANIL